jgi:hypothetical protein
MSEYEQEAPIICKSGELAALVHARGALTTLRLEFAKANLPESVNGGLDKSIASLTDMIERARMEEEGIVWKRSVFGSTPHNIHRIE